MYESDAEWREGVEAWVEALTEAVAEARVENAKTRAEYAEIRAENAEIRAENAALREENADIKRRVLALEGDADGRDTREDRIRDQLDEIKTTEGIAVKVLQSFGARLDRSEVYERAHLGLISHLYNLQRARGDTADDGTEVRRGGA